MFFGLFAPPTVQVLEFQSEVFVFVSKKKFSPGDSKVRVLIPRGPKPAHLDLPVSIGRVRPTPAGHVCIARIRVSDSARSEVDSAIKAALPTSNSNPLARRSPRYPTRLKVVCRDLPGFGAITADIGYFGVRLNAHGLVKGERPIELNIALDAGSLAPQMLIWAKPVWCVPDPAGAKGSKAHIAGMAFCDVDDATDDLLRSYLKSLAYRLDGDVMHRSIADGEMYVRCDDNVSKL